jgi:hypothetical protein
MKWGKCKNVVMGDACDYQNLEPSLDDLPLCGCCDCHMHFHVKLENDIPNFGPCQKKCNGKYYGCQSYLSLQETKKIYSYCLHHQNFQKKPSFIVVPTVFSNIKYYCSSH